MKWKKLGKIFDPTKYKLPNDCLEFAQSPQALVFNDFIRIYFSTRQRDASGKFLSHIAFIDMDKYFREIIAVSNKTVIKLGNLGCFDEHGIFPLNVVRAKDKILGFIGGWSRRVSISVETSIGLAISSDDGLTFKRIGDGPVLASSLHEPFLVGDPFVAIYENIYHMWYIYGTKWITTSAEVDPQRVYKIGHAMSEDGISWQKTGRHIIADKLNADECQALPSVINFKNKYHMFFCYRQATDFRKNKDRGYRIGYAYSEDLINWLRDDNNAGIDVSDNSWDSDMLCYPHVFHCDNNVYMLYNGNEFGRFGFGLAILEDF
jgi:sucrose-6-phosphate hydrolase SacC (GH32 family)